MGQHIFKVGILQGSERIDLCFFPSRLKVTRVIQLAEH